MRRVATCGLILALCWFGNAAAAGVIHNFDDGGGVALRHQFDRVNDRVDELAAEVTALKQAVDRLTNRLEDESSSGQAVDPSPVQTFAVKRSVVCRDGKCSEVLTRVPVLSPGLSTAASTCANGQCENGECPPGVCASGQCSGGNCLVVPTSAILTEEVPMVQQTYRTYRMVEPSYRAQPLRRVGRGIFRGGRCCGN